jgi:hypothetical protein
VIDSDISCDAKRLIDTAVTQTLQRTFELFGARELASDDVRHRRET